MGAVRVGTRLAVVVSCDVGEGNGDEECQEVGRLNRLRNWRGTATANGEEMHVQAIPYLRPVLKPLRAVLIVPAAARLQGPPHPSGDTGPPRPPVRLVRCGERTCSRCLSASEGHRGHLDRADGDCLHESHCRLKMSRRGAERRTDLMLQSAACSETETRRPRRRSPSRCGLSSAWR